MKISPKYPVIRRTQNYGKFFLPRRCTYNNLLPKATNYGAFIFKPKAKKSHITNNSKKVTLFNSLKSSFSGNSVLSYKIGTWAYHSPGATRKKSFN